VITSGRSVHVVLPGDVADATVPSGGNTYDRRVCDGLAAEGWTVREMPMIGAWPRAAPLARAGLGRSLAGLPDGAVVLLDGLVACGVPDVVVPQAQRLRLVVLVHMPLADDTALDSAVAADLDARERATLRAATAVVATSGWSARRLVAHHGLATDRVHVAAPGTDPAPVAPGTDGAAHLLCVAAVTPGKGQDVLVEALATLTDLTWCCELVGSLARDPAHVATIGKSIERYGLGDRVRLAGARTGDDLVASYAAADLLVLPSRTETYGMVVTEALARAVPVVATTAGALPDTVGRAPDGSVPGLLVPPGDAHALAAALRRWCSEPDLRKRLRTAALRRRGTLAGWPTTAAALAGVLAGLSALSAGEPA
jgi:glycosyltransferase involved in cell wall biosynthesis